MLFSGMLSAFVAAPEAVKELKGYQLKNQAISLHDYNLWVITHEVEFDKTFVADSIAEGRPEFENEMVIAAKVETFSNSYKVQFKKIVVNKNEMNVYFGVQRDKVKQDSDRPVAMITAEKNREIKKVNLFHDNVLVRSVPIVSVY